MKRVLTIPAALLLSLGPPARAQDMPVEYQQVLTELGRQGDFKAGVLKVNIPRNDVAVTVAGVKILTSTDRDAFNLINSSHVRISDSDIEGSDDAMVLKSDFALGRKIGGSDIHVINSRILSTQNNALQFGSETCGDFSNVSFSGITITAAGKAGIGITSNDGAIIDGVTYDNIIMSGTATPIFLKLDNQGRCPGHPPVGRIRNVRISNVTVTHAIDARGLQFTSTISGKPGIPIENVTLQNLKITVPGGHP